MRGLWVGLIAGVVLVGVMLRVRGLPFAYSTDELGNLYGGAWYRVLWDAEAGVNPPLLRAALHAFVPVSQVLDVGRWLSLVASCGALGMTAVLAWRLGGPWAAFGAVALLAVHPQSVRMAPVCRSYGLSAGLSAAWLVGIDAFVRSPEDRRAWWRMVVPAVLLPWIHYTWVPVILAVTAALAVRPTLRRGAVVGHAVACVGILPMIPLILGKTEARVASPSLRASLELVGGLGLTLPSVLEAPLRRVWPSPNVYAIVAILVAVGLVACAVMARREMTRALAFGALGLLAAVVAASTVQLVRPPVSILLAAFVAPLWGLWASRSWLGVITLALAVWSGAEQVRTPLWAEGEEGRRAFAGDLPAWVQRANGRPIHLIGGGLASAVVYYRTREHIMVWPMSDDCAEGAGCFELEGAHFVVTDRERALRAEGLVVDVEHLPQRAVTVAADPLDARCEKVEDQPSLRVWDCPAP